MGRDLSLRVKERIVQVSFVIALLMLTVIVLYNDVVKLIPSNPADALKILEPEMQYSSITFRPDKLKADATP